VHIVIKACAASIAHFTWHESGYTVMKKMPVQNLSLREVPRTVVSWYSIKKLLRYRYYRVIVLHCSGMDISQLRVKCRFPLCSSVGKPDSHSVSKVSSEKKV
jgi:hypothetical protein